MNISLHAFIYGTSDWYTTQNKLFINITIAVKNIKNWTVTDESFFDILIQTIFQIETEVA